MLEKLQELRTAADEDSFFETGAGQVFNAVTAPAAASGLVYKSRGLGLALTVRRRLLGSAGDFCETLPAVLMYLLSRTKSVRKKIYILIRRCSGVWVGRVPAI